MEQIITQIIDNFDFAYMLVINILTYLLIYGIEDYNKIRVVTKDKRILLCASIVIVTIIYLAIGYENKIILINSAIATPVAWTWILKPIFNKLGLGYKQTNKQK